MLPLYLAISQNIYIIILILIESSAVRGDDISLHVTEANNLLRQLYHVDTGMCPQRRIFYTRLIRNSYVY